MNRFMKRSGLILASVVLVGSAGCGGNSTEVPLAKVAPVAPPTDSAKSKPRAGAVVSPGYVQGHN